MLICLTASLPRPFDPPGDLLREVPIPKTTCSFQGKELGDSPAQRWVCSSLRAFFLGWARISIVRATPPTPNTPMVNALFLSGGFGADGFWACSLPSASCLPEAPSMPLRNPGMADRHWEQVSNLVGTPVNPTMEAQKRMRFLFARLGPPARCPVTNFWGRVPLLKYRRFRKKWVPLYSWGAAGDDPDLQWCHFLESCLEQMPNRQSTTEEKQKNQNDEVKT